MDNGPLQESITTISKAMARLPDTATHLRAEDETSTCNVLPPLGAGTPDKEPAGLMWEVVTV
jgi:hypothetical protein